MAMCTIPLDAHLMTGRDALAGGEALPVAVLLVFNLLKRLEFLRDHFHRSISILSGKKQRWPVVMREVGARNRAAGRALAKSPKSLMRMLSAEGNPQARNLCEMVATLQKIEGTRLEVRAAAAA
jgi:hypothetical protein